MEKKIRLIFARYGSKLVLLLALQFPTSCSQRPLVICDEPEDWNFNLLWELETDLSKCELEIAGDDLVCLHGGKSVTSMNLETGDTNWTHTLDVDMGYHQLAYATSHLKNVSGGTVFLECTEEPVTGEMRHRSKGLDLSSGNLLMDLPVELDGERFPNVGGGTIFLDGRVLKEDSLVYFIQQDGIVHGFDLQHDSSLWQVPLYKQAKRGPSSFGDSLYVMTENALLYSIHGLTGGYRSHFLPPTKGYYMGGEILSDHLIVLWDANHTVTCFNFMEQQVIWESKYFHYPSYQNTRPSSLIPILGPKKNGVIVDPKTGQSINEIHYPETYFIRKVAEDRYVVSDIDCLYVMDGMGNRLGRIQGGLLFWMSIDAKNGRLARTYRGKLQVFDIVGE